MTWQRTQRGFTLIEMVITVAIVGLLATAVFPLAELGVTRSKERDLKSALWTIREALDNYKMAADAGHIERELGDSGYPENLDVLVEGVVDLKSPDSKMLYFLRRVPRDPFYPDASVPPAETWALRSYESGPQDPQPGDDVYDVHSMSTRTALDGTRYADW
jgi:general secretion pathway protein G